MTDDAHLSVLSGADDRAADPIAALSDAQVFARDPEDFTKEDIANTIVRLSKLLARFRKARADSAALAETAAKLKKVNAAAKKKKSKAANLEELVI